MKIGITGCAGYIGSRAIGYFLDKGYEVKGMDNFYKGHCDSLFHYINNPKFQFIEGSVTRPKDCDRLINGCDAVIHLAALVGFPVCARNEDLAWAVNVKGTENILNARELYNGNIMDFPFILTSTGSVYGAVTDQICTENTPCNTETIYGKTKLAAESLVKEERNTVIFRYATAFGVSPCMRVKLLVNDFVHQAHTEKAIVLFEADFKRTFIHISDFIRSLEFAIKNYKNMPEKIFNAGDPALNWSKRQLATYVAQQTGCSLFFGETGKDLDVRNYEVSTELLNSKGFKCEVSMEQGIKELIKAVPLLRVGNRYEPN